MIYIVYMMTSASAYLNSRFMTTSDAHMIFAVIRPIDQIVDNLIGRPLPLDTPSESTKGFGSSDNTQKTTIVSGKTRSEKKEEYRTRKKLVKASPSLKRLVKTGKDSKPALRDSAR